MLEFHIGLSEEEYIKFNEYHLLHSASGKKAIRRYQLIFPFISILLLGLLWLVDVDPEILLIEAILLGIISMFTVFSAKKTLIRSIVKTVTKLKKEGKLPYHSETIVTFEDDGIRERSAHTENKTSYHIVEKIVQSDRAIYVYISAVQAIIIPKSCFETTDQINELLQYLDMKCQFGK
jgi:hypothetical protein